MAKYQDDNQAESPYMVAGAVFAVLFTMGFLIWLVASNRIVYGSLKPALLFGAMWKWFPSDLATTQWNNLVLTTQAFARRPAEVSVVEWGAYISTAFRPLAAIILLLYAGLLVLLLRRRVDVARRFTADTLMAHTGQIFTGILPVVALRKKIAKNELPLWRLQVTPEEVFTSYRVPAHVNIKDLPPGTPIVRDGQLDHGVAYCYFVGGKPGALEGGRLDSIMLGRQVVDLPRDVPKSKSRALVYADRMSNEGKAVLALWAAVAFSGEVGRNEYFEYRDKLNRTAFRTKDGMANLAVIQPLYDKYRKHPMVQKLFAIHHWEHTVLYALLALAQRHWRITTAEVLWLRPTNRVMFFAMNSRGMYTPHTEAAATYTQYQFEVGVARAKRLPLYIDASGSLQHMVYVDKAIDGLRLEYERWLEGSDENDDWWASEDVWKRTNNAVNQQFAIAAKATPTADMPGTDGRDTEFDQQERIRSEQAAKEERDRIPNELARALGDDPEF